MTAPHRVYPAEPPQITLDHALAYLGVGLGLLPTHGIANGRCTCGEDCGRDAGKHPVSRLVPSGVNSARTDEETVRRWLARWPRSNIAVACGSLSGVVVVDADGAPGVAELERRGYPTTWTARSGSGGLHVYLEHPGYPVGNWMIQGIGELRADGGYVVAPPSRHRSGGCYEWLPGLSPWEVDLAPAPDWAPLVSRQETPSVSRPTEVGPTPDLSRLSLRMQDLVRYGNGGEYKSRSEADLAVCLAMLGAGYTETEIWAVLTNPSHGVSEKFFEKGRCGERYLELTIAKAKARAEVWPRRRPSRSRARRIRKGGPRG